MDVQQQYSRERVFSILNDNDCPSFVIRQKPLQKQPNDSSASPSPTRLPSINTISSRLERPHFFRQSQYQRNSSISSAGSPPLLRYDSTSSKASSSSMDSTPSPITPAYQYNDAHSATYDNLLRSDLSTAYLPSPTGITPFMDAQMMINPAATAHLSVFEPKVAALATVYPMSVNADVPQLPTPSLSNHPSMSSTASSQPQSKNAPNGSLPTGKKNKYPCPYAQSHSCLATFTTSGHAARHGKKHTGEKGVHCPVCNKAFTRKDNMKQHERTHKNKSSSDETRSKAAITKDAQKNKAHKKSASSVSSTHTRRASLLQSPISEVTSLAPNTIDTPINLQEPTLYQDPSPPILLVPDGSLAADPLNPSSLYPPLGEESLVSVGQLEKLDSSIPMPPTLIRGFSDLDTLAQAAESFDPYYPHQF